MPYCPNCGNALGDGDRFCSNCGTSVQDITAVKAADVNPGTSARSDYRIVLISRGDCKRTVAIDMISDLLGYTDADAAKILENLPMEIALGLTAIQAQYISQALTEYGMEVAIYNSDGYVDMGSRATSSVFDSDGSFLNTVASVLTGLTIGNRISSFSRWTRSAPLVFRPAYRRPAPVVTYRRRRPAPRPAPTVIPVIHHAATPVPRPAPRPAPPPRPSPSARPVPPPHPTPAPRPAPKPVTPQRGVPGKPGGTGRGGKGGPMGPGGRRG